MNSYLKKSVINCNIGPDIGQDNSSLTSHSSEDSFTDKSSSSFVEKGVNTDDTFRLVPFDVDHWASKCIRFADEFQTSRSFEDAQSNICELEESLCEYLKLRQEDGSLRVDILMHCVLTNIIEGLNANSSIFVNEVPSVSKIITKCLQTSGLLGRYGFQSFKQSLKAVQFLQEYYRKHEIPAPKLPIVLWQSVKRVSLKGTTLYPTLYPAEFHFHREICPDSENCKSIRIDFSSTKTSPIYLKHCISSSEIIEAVKNLANQDFDFGCEHVEPELELKSPNSIPHQATRLSDTCLQQLIPCDIDLNLSSDKQLISNITLQQPKYSESFKQLQQNMGGSVVVRFKSRYFNVISNSTNKDKGNVFILGTKQYRQEHSQILLVDTDITEESFWLVADQIGKKVQEAERIENIQEFKWDLKFGSCDIGCWTHPEIMFVEKIKLLLFLEDCSISFEDHVCTSDTHLKHKCSDCLLTQQNSISVDQVFDTGIVQINVRLDLKCLGLFESKENAADSNGSTFSLFKFALSVPVDSRQLLIELQKESKVRKRDGNGLFCDDDFEKILQLWEQHKEYYYAVWYSS